MRLLGQGGMGAVFEAVDERLSRTVALKQTLADTDDLKRAFEREARLLANLNHPTLPRVIDHFTEGGGQYLVMDYVPGLDLNAQLEEQGRPFAVEEVLRWADELLDALEYLHSHEPPILHRDIKPSNLKLTAKGRIVLLDFGLAKGIAGQMTAATLSRSILGYSPHFAPLEQMQGEKTSPRSDIYSLGATLYHLMTGVKPPDALTRITDVANVQSDPLLPANKVNSNIPPSVSSALAQAMMHRRDLRPSATELRKALREHTRRPLPILPSSSETTVLADRSAAPKKPPRVSETTVVRRPALTPATEHSRVQKSNRAYWISGLVVAALTLLAVGIGLTFLGYRYKSEAISG
jgi:serine/threonine protein kinase